MSDESDNLPEKRLPMSEIARIAKAAADAGWASSAGSAGVKLAAAQSLGLAPETGLWHIEEVKGRPMVKPEALRGLINNSPNVDYEIETSREQATVTIWRKSKRTGEWEAMPPVAFTIDDAKKAGLTKNPAWTNFPAEMLAARATSRAVRLYCPEVAMNLPVGDPDPEDYAHPRADLGDQPEIPTETVRVSEPETDEPVLGEIVEEGNDTDEVVVVEEPPVEAEAVAVEFITQAQIRRLWATAREAIPEDTQATLKRIVKWLCKVESTKEIRTDAYDMLITVVESWPESLEMMENAEGE